MMSVSIRRFPALGEDIFLVYLATEIQKRRKTLAAPTDNNLTSQSMATFCHLVDYDVTLTFSGFLCTIINKYLSYKMLFTR